MALPRPLAVLTLGLALACNGPLPFLSGGALSGDARPAPTRWALESDQGFCQLETRPEDPYSVNLAYVQWAGRLYVYAGDTETQWVKNMEANPLVRLRLSGALYTLRAQRVLDPAEIAAFAAFWRDASIFHRDPTKLTHLWLYRLVAPNPQPEPVVANPD